MKKLLTATGAALVLANVTIAPAFADSLTPQTTRGKQQQVVLPEGQMMSDAELAQVEGEVLWTPILVGAGGGAAVNVAKKTYECYSIPGARCGFQQYAGAAASGAVTGALIPAAKAYGAVNLANYARATWFLRR